MRKIILISFFFFFLASCNQYSSKIKTALNAAGENSAALEKVLDFYSKKPEDSLKYKAAVFLIENLPYHFSYKPIREFDQDFDSVNKIQKETQLVEIFLEILEHTSKTKQITTPKLLPDSQEIKSQFLINNIEFSFKAWSRIPKEKRASFEDFCNYILPYKSENEPIEEKSKPTLAKRYAWVYKKVNSGVSISEVVEELKEEVKYLIITDISKFYPQPLSISQVEKSKMGLCYDGVNYLVNIFRSLGIVSAADSTPHWGNHPALGHSWLYVKYGKEEYYTDVTKKIDLKPLYANESLAVILRQTYSYQKENILYPLAKEVTNEYVTTTDIIIPNKLGAPTSNPVLCVFDYENQWAPIALGTIENDSFVFKNIGANVLYMAANQAKNEIIPISYPFFIDKAKKIHFYIPSATKVNTALLTRKCRLSSPRNRKIIFELMDCLNGALIQGANKADFSDAETLYQINNHRSSQLKKVKLTPSKKFKYVRFNSNDKAATLARLAFYGSKGEILTGTVLQEGVRNYKWEKSAFDDDPLTYSTGINKKPFKLGYAFEKPQTITAIEFQRKNDMNHIVVGNKYELFYWDKQWKTLGIQVAKDTLLQYSKVPDNALFWLRNNTGGKEEQPFVIDGNNRQHWPGSDNY